MITIAHSAVSCYL